MNEYKEINWCSSFTLHPPSSSSSSADSQVRVPRARPRLHLPYPSQCAEGAVIGTELQLPDPTRPRGALTWRSSASDDGRRPASGLFFLHFLPPLPATMAGLVGATGLVVPVYP